MERQDANPKLWQSNALDLSRFQVLVVLNCFHALNNMVRVLIG